MSLVLLDNRRIQALNKKFFGKDCPTNVISFSYLEGPSGEIFGEIIISVEKAREEAERLSVDFHERFFALIIHGLLHILGFEHEGNKKGARRMQYREKKLLAYVTSQESYRDLIRGKA